MDLLALPYITAFFGVVAAVNALAWRWIAPSREAAGWLTALSSAPTILCLYAGFLVWAKLRDNPARDETGLGLIGAAMLLSIPVIVSGYLGLLVGAMLWKPRSVA